MDWYQVCRVQTLREAFLEEMERYLYWPEVGRHQNIREAFILRHLEQLSAEDVLSNRTLSIKFYQRLLELQEQAEE